MEIFIVFAAIVLILLIIERKARIMYPLNKIPEPIRVVYPLEPMMVNYADIQDAIEDCSNIKTLNAIFVRIIIFQGCYSDSEIFYSELILQFVDKEAELNTINM